MVYLHLTTQGHEHAYTIINTLMTGLRFEATAGKEGDGHDDDK
jgi:hypothetical protein